MARHNMIETEQLTDPVYYIMLALLEERHGYVIMKYIEEISEGEVIIGAATLYTTIKKLLKPELIELCSAEERKKTYKVTSKGKELLILEVKRRKKMAEQGIKILNEIEGGTI